MHGAGSTTYFDQLGLHRLIALVPDTGELRAFARDVLGPLADGTTEAADLRETLQVLLDTNFNVAEAARLQFFHYNTMRYRVCKLERLLGPLSSDPHLRLDVAVALRVLEVAGADLAPTRAIRHRRSFGTNRRRGCVMASLRCGFSGDGSEDLHPWEGADRVVDVQVGSSRSGSG